jgi:hypothetical protein
MKSDFIEFIGNARQRRSEKFRNQLSVFIACLVLSVFIWALVRLSKDYYYTIEYRLNFHQVPRNLKLAGCSDSTLNLRIKVQGFEFFSEHFLIKQEREFEVSLRNVHLRNSGEHIMGYLLTNRIGKEIIAQTNFPSEVYFVSPDTLFFEFEKMIIKRFPASISTNFIRMEVDGKDTVLHLTDSLMKKIDPKSLLKKH